MPSKLIGKQIKGAALELIMRDVLQGMTQYTEEVCAGCNATDLEIHAIEAVGKGRLMSMNNILPFQRPGKTA
jgi:hypothetical protein